MRDSTGSGDDTPTGTPTATPREPATPPPAASPGVARAVWPTVAVPAASQRPSGPRASFQRQWLGAAVVAAVVGALVGGGIVWAARSGATSPATITIEQDSTAPGAATLASGETIPSLVRSVAPSVVSIDVTGSNESDQGTGMIISPSGLVVTNNHVVALAEASEATITVTRTGTSRTLPAALLGHSAKDDVALLQIQGVSGLPAVTFGNSRDLVVGDEVVAIGNALGLAAGTPTVTQGIVSALGRTVSAGNDVTGATETLRGLIQTDAAINPGNSGGPLVDDTGQVIGMNTAVAGATSDGTNAQNIGFAIPSSRIEALLPTLLREHVTTHPLFSKGGYLGLYLLTVDQQVQAIEGLTVRSGAYVSQVVPGDPAAVGGIRTGDVIVAMNSTSIASAEDVERFMRSTAPGTDIAVEVERGSRALTLHVVAGQPPNVG